MKRIVFIALAMVLSSLMMFHCTQPLFPQPPADPTELTAVGGVGQVVLDWNQAGVVDGFWVRFQVIGIEGRSWSTPIEVGPPPATVIQEPGIYNWELQSRKGNLSSNWVQGPEFETVWITDPF